MKTDVSTKASQYLIDLTRERVEQACTRLGVKRIELVELIMAQRPELSDRRHSVHAAVYGNQAYPYLYEILPEIKAPESVNDEKAA